MMTPVSTTTPSLKRSLRLFDAVNLGVGSMIGAGIFVVLAPVAALAGTWWWLAVLLAVVVAIANALAVAALAMKHHNSGGAYLYGTRELGPVPGFLAGWGFVTGKTASCAAMAYTVGLYLAPDLAVPLGLAAIVLVTGVNLLGVTRTALAARVIVIPVLILLVALSVAALSGGFSQYDDAAPVLEAGPDSPWLVLQAAGLMFFAFAGYARIATMGEEVREPRKNIPRAIMIALSITLAVYALVWTAGVASVGVQGLANSPAPLETVAESAGWPAWIITVGAAVAALGALLALVAGISRTALAMSRERDLPQAFGQVSESHGVPWFAQIVVAILAALLIVATDPTTIIGFSSFGVLVYYAIANASALKLGASERPRFSPMWLNAVGLVLCVALVVTLPLTSILVMMGVYAVGLALRWVLRRNAKIV
ncbi:APC family permease [Neomicrococcus aestuarii]